MPPAPTALARPGEAERYLLGLAGRVRLMQRALLTQMVALGAVLAEARGSVGRRRFRAWLPDAGFSRSSAYRLMRVAEVFGPHFAHAPPAGASQTGTVCPSAAYLLAESTAPPEAARYAAELARGGKTVRASDAREILSAYAPVRVELGEVPGLAKLTAADRAVAKPAPAQDPDANSPAWAALEHLLAGGGSLHLADTSEPGEAALACFAGTHYPAGGGRAAHAVRSTAAAVVLELAGRTPSKRCNACHALVPLDGFYLNPARPDGRMGMCRACDGARIRAAKAKGRQARRASDSSA